MKKSPLLLVSTIVFLFCSCANQDEDIPAETIAIKEMRQKSFGELPEAFFKSLEYTILHTEDEKYMFANADKILFSNGIYYISDWSNHKLVAFTESGAPYLSIMKRGRGPGEYLQITDFDIDEDGSIWILDGQSDHILKYGINGKFESSIEPAFQLDFIKCGNDGLMFCGLAPWDDSKYGGKQVLVTDMYLNPLAAYMTTGNHSILILKYRVSDSAAMEKV